MARLGLRPTEDELFEMLPPQVLSGSVTLKRLWEWPGYYAGSDGGIWSYRCKQGIRRSPKRLKSSPAGGGYLCVGLKKGDKQFCRTVARLILTAFGGPADDTVQCCHYNGVRNDNRPQNLRWDTPKGNCKDRDRHGTTAKGSRSGVAVLTEKDAIEIRNMRERGEILKVVAEKFSISLSTVADIHKGRTWKHAV